MYFELPGQISFWVIFVGTNLLFFPMHVVGLLGMPRRVYTYPGDMGWTSYNVIESIGGFITGAGILLLFGNLVWSWFRGPPAPRDPWRGPTLEWSIPSPPPEYNFAVIPTISSAYPNWDEADRVADARRLERGIGLLDVGNEQPVSTAVDAEPTEIAEMPHGSPWPFVLALCLSGMFAVLVIHQFGIAAVFLVLAGLALLGWHAYEPQKLAHLLRLDPGRPLGWWGMAMLVASEGMLFALLIGSYFYLRFKQVHWPPPGIPEPKVVVPLILLGVLVATSIPVQLAARATRVGRVRAAQALILLALAVQAGYFAMQVHLYAHDLGDFTPQRHAYGSLYFLLLGADHAHVLVGLLLSAWLIVKLAGGLTSYRRSGAQAIALYWHAVNVITIAVTLTVLSPAL
jgi:cytochrome c oxidase subunit I+III